MRVLVLNAGSSSLKASLVEPPRRTIARAETGWGADASRAPDRTPTVAAVVAQLRATAADKVPVAAVAHRVVHGGTRFVAPVSIDAEVLAGIEAVRELAPLHNGVALDVIRAALAVLPDVPHVACFDTAFHATLAPAAYRYPLPESWYTEWGVRRFGFHGLSVAWSVDRASELLNRPAGALRLVVAHLGSGCSVSAVDGGRSVATSMGWTPLEGLMMGTRAGSIDPGILLRLLADGRVDLPGLSETLDHAAGLLAVAGSADMRVVVAAADAGEPRAALALEMFTSRAAAAIASAATALPRLDALVFSGGIGEGAAGVRRSIVARLSILGIAPLAELPAGLHDGVLAALGVGIPVLRVAAREDLVMAGEVAAAIP